MLGFFFLYKFDRVFRYIFIMDFRLIPLLTSFLVDGFVCFCHDIFDILLNGYKASTYH